MFMYVLTCAFRYGMHKRLTTLIKLDNAKFFYTLTQLKRLTKQTTKKRKRICNNVVTPNTKVNNANTDDKKHKNNASHTCNWLGRPQAGKIARDSEVVAITRPW
eukprot:m.82679 g.82679  ORF g.82679 m.82679 type:complete len:104 (-) comp25541_c0_seq2:1081-1392(-)